MSLSRSFSSFFSHRHQDVVSMEVSLDYWCPNPNFYLGKATSWSAYDGLGFIPVEEETWVEVPLEEEAEEEVVEEEEEMAADPRPSKKVKWWQRALAFCCCCYEVDF